MSDHVYAISEIVGSSSEASEMPSRTRWRARKTVRPRRLSLV